MSCAPVEMRKTTRTQLPRKRPQCDVGARGAIVGDPSRFEARRRTTVGAKTVAFRLPSNWGRHERQDRFPQHQFGCSSYAAVSVDAVGRSASCRATNLPCFRLPEVHRSLESSQLELLLARPPAGPVGEALRPNGTAQCWSWPPVAPSYLDQRTRCWPRS